MKNQMEKKGLKLSISRLFHGYLRSSCQSRNVSAIAQEPIFIRGDSHPLQSSSNSLHFPSICRPKTAEFICIEDVLNTRIAPRRNVYIASNDIEGRRCPHPSPASPLNSCMKIRETTMLQERCERKKGKKKRYKDRETGDVMLSSNSSVADSRKFFSSDDKKPKETAVLFSPRSSFSDSSEFHQFPKNTNRRRCYRRARKQSSDWGFLNFASVPKEMEGKVEKSVAVMKRSSDPYSDFRSSMVEMIIERQMGSAKDLEQLLHCFLVLNSPHHHPVIVEVFSEILEALFPNWS